MSFFNRKPKVANKDFLEESLPKNRYQQFIDISKNNFTTLVLLGLWFFMFFIPILTLIFLKDALISDAYIKYGPESSEYAVKETQALSLFSLLMVVGLIIFAIGLAMGLKILKRLIFCEPVFWKYDLIEGLKENWKYFVFLSVIVGSLGILRMYFKLFLNDNIIIYYAFSSFDYILIIPYFVTFSFLSYIYDENIFLRLKHSFIVLIKSIIFLAPLLAVFYSSLFLNRITLPLLKYSLIIVIFIIGFPFYLLALFELNFYFFDKLINKTNFPSIYRIGLRKQQKQA